MFKNNLNTFSVNCVGSLLGLIWFRFIKSHPSWLVDCVNVAFCNINQVLDESACILPLDTRQLKGTRRVKKLIKKKEQMLRKVT